MDAKHLDKYRGRLFHRVPLVGGWLQRRAARALAADGSVPALRVLAEALARGSDGRVQALARETLERLDHQNGVDAVAAVWAGGRHPALEELLCRRGLLPLGPPDVRLLAALKLGRREPLRDLGPDDVGHLVAALEDTDATVAREAERLVAELSDPWARAALAGGLCGRWAETRSPRLEALVVQGRFVAERPLPVRVLGALKTGQEGLLRELGAEVAEPLVGACADADPVIAAGAARTLRGLSHPDAQEAVCRLFLERDDRHARDAALEAGYLPGDEHRRALFFFLTGQWERYEALDFDRRLLAAVHEAADAGLRQRIVEKVRTAGRTDYLTVLAGSDYRSRARRMTAAEADVLVQMLTDHGEWDRLWALAFELPLRTSVRIMQTLVRQAWRPGRDDDRDAFERLAALAADGMPAEEDFRKKLPPAVLRARARVSGRVNDVAFSPSRPLIAVGTGLRKLVLWDFRRGERAETHGGFGHSIGRVAFAADDSLLCAERVRPGQKCTLHGWRGGERFAVVQGGAVTALEPAGGSQVVVARRDGRVVLLDAAAGRSLTEGAFAFWCRAVRVAPDGARAALLHDRITLVGLPGLEVLAEGRGGGGRVLSCAAFVEGGLVAGRFNGEVLLYRCRGEDLIPQRQALAGHEKGVQGVEWLGRYSALLTAGAEGALIFTAWPGGAVLGRVRVEGERLTSVHVSPGGEFMAVGDSDASMSLWDLRVLEVPALLARPFAAALPAHLAAVNALLDAGAVPAGVGPALRFVQCVLQHRFRYDVEVDEVPGIRAGEFDIEVA